MLCSSVKISLIDKTCEHREHLLISKIIFHDILKAYEKNAKAFGRGNQCGANFRVSLKKHVIL